MRAVTTQLDEMAQSIFADLGYEVSRDGVEFRAERKWRVVRVTPVEEPGDAPTGGQYRCFVTWEDTANEIVARLARENPDYEWAVITVDDDGSHEVHRRSSAA